MRAAHRLGVRLARRLGRVVARGGRSWPGRDPQPLPSTLSERVPHALDLVARVERLEAALPTASAARTFLAADRAVVAQDAAQDMSALVPPALRRRLREGTGVDLHTAGVAADSLVLAKFDLEGQLKLRAHYAGPRLTLAVAPRPRGEGTRDAVLNAVRAQQVVATHSPGLAPRVLAHGVLGRHVRYLVEEWVDGEPVLTSGGLAESLPQVLDGLARLHRGYGVSLVPLAERWGPTLAQHWTQLVASGVLPAQVGTAVTELIAANREVRVSWTHGDPVATNVLRTAGGEVVLVDWEHSREGLLMHDAAKLHLFSAEPGRTLPLVLDTWAHDAGPQAYTVAEELLLAHARLLSRYPARRADLEGHPRAAVYEKQVRRQVALLGEVLDEVQR